MIRTMSCILTTGFALPAQADGPHILTSAVDHCTQVMVPSDAVFDVSDHWTPIPKSDSATALQLTVAAESLSWSLDEIPGRAQNASDWAAAFSASNMFSIAFAMERAQEDSDAGDLMLFAHIDDPTAYLSITRDRPDAEFLDGLAGYVGCTLVFADTSATDTQAIQDHLAFLPQSTNDIATYAQGSLKGFTPDGWKYISEIMMIEPDLSQISGKHAPFAISIETYWDD